MNQFDITLSMSAIVRGQLYQIEPYLGESTESLYERLYYIIQRNPTNKSEFDALETESKVWLQKKLFQKYIDLR